VSDCHHESVSRIRSMWLQRSFPTWRCDKCATKFSLAPTLQQVMDRAKESGIHRIERQQDLISQVCALANSRQWELSLHIDGAVYRCDEDTWDEQP